MLFAKSAIFDSGTERVKKAGSKILHSRLFFLQARSIFFFFLSFFLFVFYLFTFWLYFFIFLYGSIPKQHKLSQLTPITLEMLRIHITYFVNGQHGDKTQMMTAKPSLWGIRQIVIDNEKLATNIKRVFAQENPQVS